MSPSALGKIGKLIQDAVAPNFCVQCGVPGGWLCEICAEQIMLVGQPVCYRCGKLSERGRTCPRCRRHSELNGVLVATHYGAGPVREMVHKLKYEGMTDLTGVLGEMLVCVLLPDGWQDWVMVPVPLHAGRLAERGFNQAELLARWIARRTGLECRPRWLQRVRPTCTQTTLTRGQRQANLLRAFRSRRDLSGQKIILIDDVMTTGATLEEAARALKNAGARSVWAAVVARGS